MSTAMATIEASVARPRPGALMARARAIPIVDADQAAAEEWQANFAEDAAEPEPDFEQIAQVLSNAKTERIAFRPDLHAELKAAKEQVAVFGGYRDLIKALHVPRTAFVESGGLGLLRITTEQGEADEKPVGRYFIPSYENDKDSQLALIVPVWNGLGGDLIDLLAVRLDHPAQFYVRSGFARCLGEWNADTVRDNTTLWPSPDDVHPSLVLAPNPLTWLRGDCAGVCILNEAWLSHTLVGIKSVTVTSEKHAASLRKFLIYPSAPKVFLRRHREAA